MFPVSFLDVLFPRATPRRRCNLEFSSRIAVSLAGGWAQPTQLHILVLSRNRNVFLSCLANWISGKERIGWESVLLSVPPRELLY